ncbi:MAG: phage virion morphogenesis protein [Pseudomonadota bacterium]
MIDVQINDEEVIARFQALVARYEDLSRPMNEIGFALVETTRERFFKGVSPEGVPWAANAPSTLARPGVDFRPLFGTNPAGVALHTSAAHSFGRDYVEVSSNKIQAAVMQFGAKKGAFGNTSRGSPIPWGDIPARPFLGLSDKDRSNIAETVEEWLTGASDA